MRGMVLPTDIEHSCIDIAYIREIIMETRIYNITDPEKDKEKIEEAAELMRNGGIVAFPTDTVYALGCCLDHEDAIDKLFEVKNRARDNPIGVLVARDLDMHLCIDIVSPNNQFAARLIENFWPGPLTIIMPRILSRVPDNLVSGLRTVGVRQPDDPVAQALIYAVGAPVAATSANISGNPAPVTARHVIDDFDGKIDMILAGQDCKTGMASTIIDLSGDDLVVTRQGPLTVEQMQEVIPKRILTL